MGMWNNTHIDEQSEQIQKLVRLELDSIADRLLERAKAIQERADQTDDRFHKAALVGAALSLTETIKALTGGDP